MNQNSKNTDRLLYFTASYPYGIGEEWKKNELEVLREYFDEIIVIPFDYGSNFESPKPPIEGIQYVKPLFQVPPKESNINKLKVILKSKYVLTYLYELLSNLSGLDKYKISQWLHSCFLIEQLRKKNVVKSLLLETTEPTIAYFFWGRLTAEVLTILNNKNVTSAVKLHGYDLYAYRYKSNYIPFQEFQIKNAHLVLPISENGAVYLKSRYPDYQQKIKVSKLGTTFLGKSRPSRDNTLRIFSCSSIIPLKRLEIIAGALKLIKDFPIIWIHIGDGAELTNLEKLTKDLPGNIQVNLPGWVPSEQVKSFYAGQRADLFLNVSETEGIPVSIMEAMSAEIPVYATNVGGVSEIANNRNGKLLPENLTPYKLAEEIKQFYHLPEEEKEAMRTTSFDTFHSHYDAVKNAHSLARLLLQNTGTCSPSSTTA